MKHLYAFLFLLISSAVAHAQPDRLIAICQSQNLLWQGFVPVDSFVFLYNPGNMSTGTVEDYYNDSLLCDEMIHFTHYGIHGYYKYKQHYYQYDNNGRLIKETVKQLGANSVLEDKYQDQYVYNAAGYQTHKYSMEYSNNKWDSTTHTFNTYDAANNLLVSETWWLSTFTNNWQPYGRDSFGYDAANRLLCWTRFYVHPTLQFQPSFRYIFTYNAQGLLDTDMYQTYTSYWKNSRLQTYHYNAQGLTDTQLYFSYNASQWQKGSMTAIAYNSNQQEELQTVFIYSGTAWTPDHDFYTVYDAQGHMLYRDKRDIDQSPPHLGIITRDSVETWSTSPLLIREVHKENNGMGLRNKTMMERLADAQGRWVAWTTGNWDTVQHSWVPGYSKTTFTYGKGLHVGNVAATRQLGIYPNPAVSYIVTDAPLAARQSGTAAIYDMSGRLVQQQHIPAGTPRLVLPTAHLGAGTYILSITSGSEKAIAQFVVAPQ